jgi:hypothetical protein
MRESKSEKEGEQKIAVWKLIMKGSSFTQRGSFLLDTSQVHYFLTGPQCGGLKRLFPSPKIKERRSKDEFTLGLHSEIAHFSRAPVRNKHRLKNQH